MARVYLPGRSWRANVAASAAGGAVAAVGAARDLGDSPIDRSGHRLGAAADELGAFSWRTRCVALHLDQRVPGQLGAAGHRHSASLRLLFGAAENRVIPSGADAPPLG